MKKIVLAAAIALTIIGCGNDGNGYLLFSGQKKLFSFDEVNTLHIADSVPCGPIYNAQQVTIKGVMDGKKTEFVFTIPDSNKTKLTNAAFTDTIGCWEGSCDNYKIEIAPNKKSGTLTFNQTELLGQSSSDIEKISGSIDFEISDAPVDIYLLSPSIALSCEPFSID